MTHHQNFSHHLRDERGCSMIERDFQAWLFQVERTARDENLILTALISDAAIHAFEEGVSASDFALALQATPLRQEASQGAGVA